MSYRENRERLFGDAVYEAWRSGRDSDLVDRDRLYDDHYSGFTSEECISMEIHRITPKPREQDEFSGDYEEQS